MEKKMIYEHETTGQFIREVRIQMFLSHPNIIKIYGCMAPIFTSSWRWEPAGSFINSLKVPASGLTQDGLAMRQVCEALSRIHSLRIIHCDIEPENIMLHDLTMLLLRKSSKFAIFGGRCTRKTDRGPPSAALHSTSVLISSKAENMTKR